MAAKVFFIIFPEIIFFIFIFIQQFIFWGSLDSLVVNTSISKYKKLMGGDERKVLLQPQGFDMASNAYTVLLPTSL